MNFYNMSVQAGFDVNVVHIKELKPFFSSYIRRYVQSNT